MTKFRYKARTRDGEMLNGSVDAETKDAVAAQLIERGLVPLQIEKASAGFNWNMTIIKTKPSLPELMIFCRQMHVLLKSGVSFVDAVSDLRTITKTVSFQDALEGIINAISSGMTVSSAIAQQHDILPPMFVSILESGERAGRLDEAFSDLADFLDFEYRTKKQFKATMRYPVMVFSAVIVAMLVINVLVVPAFSKMLTGFNVPLPLPTKILIGTSNFIMTRWWVIIIAIVMAIVLFRAILKTDSGRKFFDKMMLKLPIFGRILYRIALSRFVRSFSVVMQAGIPIVEGLQFIANSVGNRYIQAGIRFIAEHIERGESFSYAAQGSKLFDPVAMQMITVGEQSGQIDALLVELSQFYDSEVEYDLKRLNELIEPIVLVILGGMVLMLALGVFMPIWNMVQVAKF